MPSHFEISAHLSSSGRARTWRCASKSLTRTVSSNWAFDIANPNVVSRDPAATHQITAFVSNAAVTAGDDIVVDAGYDPAFGSAPKSFDVFGAAVTLPDEVNSRIVTVTVGGAAATDVRAPDVREALRKSNTQLYVMSPVGSVGGSGGNTQLDIVLNDGSRDTGGRHDRFSGQTVNKVAEQISQELLNQYQLTYVLPDGAKPSDRLEVATKRKGLKVNAPTRIAN